MQLRHHLALVVLGGLIATGTKTLERSVVSGIQDYRTGLTSIKISTTVLTVSR